MLLKFTLLLCILGLVVCQESNKKVAEKDPLPFGPTTTDGPDTTTPPPTTTIPPDTTTAATTTSTSAPTTTSAPTPTTPVPPADIGTWNVTDPTTNITCIMAKMAVQLSISYSVGENKTSTAVIDVPANTSSVSGTCGNDTQSIVISWIPDTLSKTNMLLLEFSQNASAKTYMLSTVNLTINPDTINFPGAASTDEIKLTSEAADKLPSAPKSMSYRCTPSQSYNLTGNSMITFSQLQLEAFHTESEAKFGSASDCQAQDSADIVPIAVGCALAALVVIVLVAYLIGRRRTHAKGYLSM